MAMARGLTTQQKALQINLDTTIYGTFAEIGAGQEVAANFFKAGGSSGTVAKSMSAYDMVFSDSIYGKEKTGRYVCHPRLLKMMNYEYDLVVERLSSVRPDGRFFAFANTVSARNYHGTNESHGWLGLRFRSTPEEAPSDLVLHIRMHDNSNVLQQNAIGILGVNMIYACYFATETKADFLDVLMENLSRDRMEIDLISVSGPCFSHFDNRILNLHLLERGLTDAVLFDKTGCITLPSDELYKKAILIARGSYRPPTHVNTDLIKVGISNFSKDTGLKSEQIVVLAEITLNNLKNEGDIQYEDFIARVDLLTSINQAVLITNYPQYFKLTTYLQRFKPVKLGIVLGAYNFMQIFDNEYNQASGQSLEALGLLFRPNVIVYIYPYRDDENPELTINLSTVSLSCSDNQHLLNYVKATGQVKDLVGVDQNLLNIYSRKVLNMIINDEAGWEDHVPDIIAARINEKCLFGHPCKK
jgi:hypothetical protein